MTKNPKLNTKGRFLLLNHLYENDEDPYFRCLMVSQAYLESQFCNFKSLENKLNIVATVDSFTIICNDHLLHEIGIFDLMDERVKLAIIRLVRFKHLKIKLDFEYPSTPDDVNDWVKLCKMPTLETIAIYCNCEYDRVLVPILFDCLLDKITEIHGRVNLLLQHLKHRNSILKCITLEGDTRKEKNLLSLVTAKVNSIMLHQSDHYTLLDFSPQKCLPPNPILDTLIIRLDCLLRDNVMDNSNESIRKRLPKYEKAIECVKAINPNIKLKLFAARSFSDETLDLDDSYLIVRHIKEVISNVRTFIDFVIKMNIEIVYIKVQEAVYVVGSIDEVKMFRNDLKKGVGMKETDENSKLTRVFTYNGINVEIEEFVYNNTQYSR